MSIIVTRNGKNATRLERSEFGLEDQLQQYIHDNPETIPLYEINEDTRLLVLAREFPTGSGPIDAIGVDQTGQIYLIETKLYRNSDKRLVVAQVLDYGASLWRNSIDFNVFMELLDSRARKTFGKSVQDKLKEFFEIDDFDVQLVLDNMKSNLNSGRFSFLVLMDRLHNQLRDLIVFLNRNSNFDVYAVELDYYNYGEFEIVIPRLYGAEVKKEMKAPRKGLIMSEAEIVREYSEIGLGRQITEYLEIYNDVKNGTKSVPNIRVSDMTTRYLSFNRIDDSYSTITLYIKPEKEPVIEVWISQAKQNDVRIAVGLYLNGASVVPEIKKSNGKIAKWPLINFDRAQFLKFLETLGTAKEYVR